MYDSHFKEHSLKAPRTVLGMRVIRTAIYAAIDQAPVLMRNAGIHQRLNPEMRPILSNPGEILARILTNRTKNKSSIE
jgi:hypothetical protein